MLGEIVEEGTHDELMKKEGLYHSLVMYQQAVQVRLWATIWAFNTFDSLYSQTPHCSSISLNRPILQDQDDEDMAVPMPTSIEETKVQFLMIWEPQMGTN